MNVLAVALVAVAVVAVLVVVVVDVILAAAAVAVFVAVVALVGADEGLGSRPVAVAVMASGARDAHSGRKLGARIGPKHLPRARRGRPSLHAGPFFLMTSLHTLRKSLANFWAFAWACLVRMMLRTLAL